MAVDEAGDDRAAADVDVVSAAGASAAGPTQATWPPSTTSAAYSITGRSGCQVTSSPMSVRTVLRHAPHPVGGGGQRATDLGSLAAGVVPAAVDHHRDDVLGGGGEDRGLGAGAGAGGADARGVEGDEVGAGPDRDPAGVGEAERGVAVGGRGGEQLGGGPVAAPLGGQPLVELDRAHLLEQVDDRVAVGAQREPAAGVVQPPRGADAVAEVALGGRAEAGVGAALAEQRDVVVGEVGGVHGAGPRAEGAGVGEQLRRGDAVRREAGLVLGDLLGEVDVQRRSRRQPRRPRRAARAGRRGRSGSRRRRRLLSLPAQLRGSAAQASASPSEKRTCALGGRAPNPAAR